MCAAYGWTLDQVASMTPTQFEYAYKCLPEVELRRAYPLAALEATVMNAAGGKPDPNSEDSKPLPPDRAYSALERLPWFAKPEWVAEADAGGIPREAAEDFLAHKGRLPDWVVAIAPVGEITAAAT